MSGSPSRRYFEGANSSLPDDELTGLIQRGLDELIADPAYISETQLAREDVEAIRECAYNAGPKSRALSLEFFVDFCPCTWEDLEKLALDADERVRCPIVSVPSFGPARELLESDKPRWVRLLVEAARRYRDDYWPAITLCDMVNKYPETLDLTWSAAEGLLDIGDPELYSMLAVCYFEDVIPDLGLGPDDKHVEPWLTGSDGVRQRILLRIATYKGLDKGRMREIVEALTHATDKEIALIAEGVLAGRVKYEDILVETSPMGGTDD